MNSRELRSLEEDGIEAALLAVYNLKLNRAGYPPRTLDEMKKAEGKWFFTELEETRVAINAFLSSRPKAGSPTSPTGLEEAEYRKWWDGLTLQGDPMRRLYLVREAFAAGWAIRRSVEEALVAAHAPKGAPLGGEE